MRYFVRQSIKGGKVCSFNQKYKSKTCNDILRIISEELNVRGNIYDVIEAYFEYKNKYLKIYLMIIEKRTYMKKKNLSMKNQVNFQYIN